MHSDTDLVKGAARRVGGLAIITDGNGAVLLVHKNYDGKKWGLPGGCAYAAESPYAACVREVHEETGLHIKPEVLLLVDFMPRNDDTGAVPGLNFVFDGGEVMTGAKIVLPIAPAGEDPELIGYDFVDPARISDLVAPYTERRIRESLVVREDPFQGPKYLEHGFPVPRPTGSD
ncbi:NUDIX domain-containing protein [Streptomyces sp. NPDC048281]|uniref:NUDIX domain-containing protein n=1 Tax=Streptomyces sp. NPDC048281 TaxID=3154715 RepID=UPI0034473D79